MKTPLSMLFAGSLALSCLAAAGAAPEQPPAVVTVSQVIRQEISAGQSFVGSVAPRKRAVIGSPVDGRVIELMAQEGDRVEAFQPLVQLLTSTIDKDLAALEAELVLRKHELEELENGSRPFEIQQAEAKMLGAKASFEYAQARFRRLSKLRDSRAVSQEELDEAASLATQSEQTYIDLQAAYELIVEGPRPERIAQARAQVEMQQALVERLKGIIHRHAIITRFDGYVIRESTKIGAWVQTGDPVMEVAALDEVDVEAFVAEQHVPHVHVGMTVRVEVPALADHVFSGEVVAVIPQADTQARTFPVKVRVVNTITPEGPLLKSGMYARVHLPTGSRQQAMMVPKDALVLGGSRPTVFVVDSFDGQAPSGRPARPPEVRPVPVELGVATDNLIQIMGDLKVGQYVIVEGNERLKPGQAVEVAAVRGADSAAATDK